MGVGRKADPHIVFVGGAAGEAPSDAACGRASSPARVRAYKEWIKMGTPVPDSINHHAP